MVTCISVPLEDIKNIPLPKVAIFPVMVTWVSVGLEEYKCIPPPVYSAVLLTTVTLIMEIWALELSIIAPPLILAELLLIITSVKIGLLKELRNIPPADPLTVFHEILTFVIIQFFN